MIGHFMPHIWPDDRVIKSYTSGYIRIGKFVSIIWYNFVRDCRSHFRISRNHTLHNARSGENVFLNIIIIINNNNG